MAQSGLGSTRCSRGRQSSSAVGPLSVSRLARSALTGPSEPPGGVVAVGVALSAPPLDGRDIIMAARLGRLRLYATGLRSQ